MGSAFVCGVDDECGTNNSSLLGTNPSAHTTEKCFNVGDGALSKIVVFDNNLFANIAGETTVGSGPKDLMIIESLAGDSMGLRLNWRENF